MVKTDKGQVFIIKDEITRRYLTGFDSSDGFVTVEDEKVTLYLDDRYFYKAYSSIKDVTVKKLKDFNIPTDKNIGIDFSTTTVKEYNDIKSKNSKVFDISTSLINARKLKNDKEISFIKDSCEIIEKAFYQTLKVIKEGVSEKEIARELYNNVYKLGGEGFSFDPIIAFGENSCVPHHKTSDRKLKNNEVILMDIGAVKNGYCSDMTRTMFFGNPPKEFIDNYNHVLQSAIEAENGITDGILGRDADNLARDYLKKVNLDKYFTHSLGHGIGLEIHEAPYLSPRSTETINNGAVFSIEPGIYFDGKYGIRIEDTVTLENGKVKRLFTDDKKLIIL